MKNLRKQVSCDQGYDLKVSLYLVSWRFFQLGEHMSINRAKGLLHCVQGISDNAQLIFSCVKMNPETVQASFL